MMYFPTNKTSHIESKQTIKTFDHLKEPIVITMPVYKRKNLFGNKNLSEQLKMLGHIFVVIDIETDSVYDWVYFPCEYYTNWRCSEIGTNPTIYCSTGAYGGPIGCLNPTKTTLDIYEEIDFDGFKERVEMCINSTRNRIEELNYTRSPEYKEIVLLNRIKELYQKINSNVIREEILYSDSILEILKENFSDLSYELFIKHTVAIKFFYSIADI